MKLMLLTVHGACVIVFKLLTQNWMSNPIGMNLLKCTDWKVFFFRKPPKGEWVGGRTGSKWRDFSQEAQEKLKKKKKEKLPVKKKC